MSLKVSARLQSLYIFLSVTLLLILTWLILSWQVARADPVVIRVKPTGATTGQCGGNWANACDLKYALNTLAVTGTEIWAAAGVYTPTTVSTNISATFVLMDGVALYGGFAGTETSRDLRDWILHVTVLSGDIDNNDSKDVNGVVTTTANITGTNSYHVVTTVGAGSTAVLDGFTITGGNATGGCSSNGCGGGVNGDCSSNECGGGMYSFGGGPTVRNVTFSGNIAGFGGGLYDNVSLPTLTNVLFSGNSANPHSGGGLYNYHSIPTLTNVTFDGNFATVAGGGMTNNSSTPTLNNVTFSNNSSQWGGAMFNVSASIPELMNVTFSGNSAPISFGGGGAMYNLNASPVLTNVTFFSNTTAASGGGMGNEDCNGINGPGPTLTNVTFVNNTANSNGGGMYNTSCSPTLTNVTFSGNSAHSRGGAMANVLTSAAAVRNAILWGNIATIDGSQIYNDGASSPAIADSVVQAGYVSGTNIITADPLLGPLGNYGGSTLTVPLLPGSSAIDTANAAVCPASDQRGVSRPQGAQCDIGAFESRGFALTILSGNNQSTLRNTAFTNPLVVTVAGVLSEPVNGGQITFTAPASGASAALTGSPATISGGTASVTAVANNVVGSYNVMVGAAGVTTPVNFNLTNTKPGTMTTLTSSANPSDYGHLLILTATVTSGAGTPTGTVAFYDSGVQLGVSGINASGQATYSTSSLLVGTHSITATYGGNSNLSGSTSTVLSQVVRDVPITGLRASNSSPTALGHSTFFTGTATGSHIVYTWNFGDGTVASVGNPVTHIYGAAGLYTAIVTATNSVSTVVATTPVTITNIPPVANAGPNQTVLVHSLVTLNGSSSYDPDGNVPLTYGWTQTGGPSVVLSDHAISLPTFTAPGSATALHLTFTLIVTDTGGLASGPAHVAITVMPYGVYLPLLAKNF